VLKPLTRTLAFFAKDLLSVFRQPRLILSLILGPFLTLLFFGVGYTGQRATVDTILVVPPNSGLSMNPDDYKDRLAPGFRLVAIMQEESRARAELDRRNVGAVVVWPGDVPGFLQRGEQAPLKIYFNEVNPFLIQWTDYASYVQVSELNKRILAETLGRTLPEARQVASAARQLSQDLDALVGDLDRGDRAAAHGRTQRMLATVRDLKQHGGALDVIGGVASVALGASNVGTAENASSSLDRLEKTLQALDQALASTGADISAQKDEIGRLRGEFGDQAADDKEVPAEVLVAPLRVEEHNVAPFEPTAISFFGPAAMALMLQHIAVTLMALSLVRERLPGALDLFRVAPVGPGELILGKIMSYSFIVIGVAAALFLLLTFSLGVPMLGSGPHFVLIILTLILFSLAIGMLISLVSRTDTQAVQLTMLVLLTSVFFSGFFVSLDTLVPWVRSISYAMPATYAILALQDVMLRGRAPELWQQVTPAAIAHFLFLFASLLFRRQFGR
jgi:ABC-2 type transport system permease protein